MSLLPPSRTGIVGLDHILRGGFPSSNLYLIYGPPGSGKTTLALQFLISGAESQEPVLYITLSETKPELNAVAASHGWDLGRVPVIELAHLSDQLTEGEHTLFYPAEVELTRTLSGILTEIERIQPRRVVFDSLSEIRLLAQDAWRFRRQLLALKQFFSGREATVLLLDHEEVSGTQHAESIVHGVIALKRSLRGPGNFRRSLIVEKVRGVNIQEGAHDYVIRKGGLEVFPSVINSCNDLKPKGGKLQSGVEELDALLRGGLSYGSSTLLLGPAGTGKSTVCLQYALSVARKNEQVQYYTFEENLVTLLSREGRFGDEVRAAVEGQAIRLEEIDPVTLSPGEFAIKVQSAVERNGVRLVVIDSLNGYIKAMPNEEYLLLQLHQLLAYLARNGVVTLLVLAQQGLIGPTQTPADLSYLADTILFFRYFEVKSELKTALSVLKKRGSDHERTLRELRVDSEGVRVGSTLCNMHGVLSGFPSFTGESSEMMNER